MILHTINKSPLSYTNLQTSMRFLKAGDPIILTEDGVYGASEGTAIAGTIKEVLKKNPVYALEADLQARGITKLIDGVKIVNYEGYVELTEQHNPVSWL